MQASIIVLVILYLLAAALLGRWADRRLAAHDRLPMQWGLNGRPNWSAPRRPALIVTPLLSGAGLLVGAVLILFASGEPNVRESDILGLLAALAVVGIGVYAGWLAFVTRSARTPKRRQ
ncbi:MAG: hypothetical protein ACK4FB_00715 [Brevundimonas sp.]|uniref:hypothetical protein n=1 Tax=Brevundimonas sp. TaxID=1871086 RepID=UPI00391CD7AA